MWGNRHSWLFRFAVKVLKFFLLMLFGLVVTSLVGFVLGIYELVETLMQLLRQWFPRVAACIFCLMAIAVVVESLSE